MSTAILFGLFAFFAGIAAERDGIAMAAVAILYIIAAFSSAWALGLFSRACT